MTKNTRRPCWTSTLVSTTPSASTTSTTKVLIAGRRERAGGAGCFGRVLCRCRRSSACREVRVSSTTSTRRRGQRCNVTFVVQIIKVHQRPHIATKLNNTGFGAGTSYCCNGSSSSRRAKLTLFVCGLRSSSSILCSKVRDEQGESLFGAKLH